MAGVIQSSLELILPIVQTRLMDVLGMGPERVVIDSNKDAEDDETHYQADQVVFIRTESSNPTGVFIGHGRIWPTEDVRLLCVLWTRLALDNPPGFQAGITDSILGHEVWINNIQNAIYGFIVIDTDQNWLIQNPIQPGPRSGPHRRTRGNTADRFWCKSTVRGTMTYAPRVSQNYPTYP